MRLSSDVDEDSSLWSVPKGGETVAPQPGTLASLAYLDLL